ncbi:MAG: acyl carrier protein [Ruminococcaceae bacterium]|nr:acyl carrier protein [Oscillospiraceae bacterium]
MIFETIRAIIAEQFGLPAEEITMDTDIFEDLNADSLDLVELSIAIEDEYSLDEMGEDDVKGIRTVSDLVDFVARSIA